MKKFLPVLLSTTCAAVGFTMANGAAAHEAGAFVFRAGIASVQPDDSSGTATLGPDPLAGVEVGVKSDTQLGLTAAYMLTDHIGVELLAATSYEHDITIKGLDGVGEVGSARHLPPSINLQYFPLVADSAWQPYAGIGVNYTFFFDEDTSSELDAALGNTDMSLDDSFGLSLQVGLDYVVNDNWLVNASIWRLVLGTTAEIDSDAGQVKVDVDIDPWVYMVGVGYKF